MVAITVGVACYNVEAWVEECVASLVGQTSTDFETVAVDDDSAALFAFGLIRAALSVDRPDLFGQAIAANGARHTPPGRDAGIFSPLADFHR